MKQESVTGQQVEAARRPLAGMAAIILVLCIGIFLSALKISRSLNSAVLFGGIILLGFISAVMGGALAWKVPKEKVLTYLGMTSLVMVVLAGIAPQPVQDEIVVSWNRSLWAGMVMPAVLVLCAWCGIAWVWLLQRDEVATLVSPLLGRPLRARYGEHSISPAYSGNKDTVSAFVFAQNAPGLDEEGVSVALYTLTDGAGPASDKVAALVPDRVGAWIIEHRIQPRVELSLGSTRRLVAAERPEALLTQAIQHVNEEILAVNIDRQQENLAATVAMLLVGDTAVIASVGNCRAYLLRLGGEAGITQLTTDQSFAAAIAEAASQPDADIRSDPQRRTLYQVLGKRPTVDVNVVTQALIPGDVVVLCSDGLWEALSEGVILATVVQTLRGDFGEPASPQGAAIRLAEMAVSSRRTTDNASVLVVQVE